METQTTKLRRSKVEIRKIHVKALKSSITPEKTYQEKLPDTVALNV